MPVYVPFRARNSGGDYWLPAVHGDDVVMPPAIFFTKFVILIPVPMCINCI